jgi:hypothetical protein
VLVPVVKENMAPGQKGLVVVKKALIDNESVPTWPPGDARFGDHKIFTEQWGWEIDGRKLCVVHWGTGVGDNAWQEADVVFLCDDFYLPKRTVIASVQGLRNHKATEGTLNSMKAHNSHAPEVNLLQDGHILRWTKQMALRGKGRHYDENGVCGHQKLVCSGNVKKFMTYAHVLFPGAHVECIKNDATKQTMEDTLLEILGRPNLPKKLTQSHLGQLMGRPWREISHHVLRKERKDQVLKQIAARGWEYKPGKGRRGGCFERIETTIVPALAA